MRNEHPRPDACREDWLSLNGAWDFEIDDAVVGMEKQFYKRDSLDGKIEVPFCPESKLSGIGHTDFMAAVWYLKKITLPASFAGKRVLLHIDACDYKTYVFMNDRCFGSHVGGYTPMTFDVTDALCDGENKVVIYAEDDTRSMHSMSGKQSRQLLSRGCDYTRTTGIWQTVWLEAVEAARVVSYRAYPNVADPSVTLTVKLTEASLGGKLTVTALYAGKEVGKAETRIGSTAESLTLSLAEKHLWELGKGELYDLVFTLEKDGKLDTLRGYFGLREVGLDVKGFLINGKRVFGRFVLDQGFNPDGIYTAPSDEELKADILRSMALGFNGARLHQKVFEPRFLYHADKLGYMVFDETANWGLDPTDPLNVYNFLPEWLEEIERDFSHPSVIGWCPFNETWDLDGRRQSNDFLSAVYRVTKAVDPTRPCVTVSGAYPVINDFHDVHDYEQDPATFRANYADADKGVCKDQIYRKTPNRQMFDTSSPLFVSEYGGIKWVVGESGNAWGYGKAVTTEDEFLARLEGLTDALLDNPRVCAYCYTQLTDVEQEQNGLYTYDRKLKFPVEKLRAIFAKEAAIEKE